jgi:hemerythrin superfamily protein
MAVGMASSFRRQASVGPPAWHLNSILAGRVQKAPQEFGMNALNILKKDHSTVRSLFNKYSRAGKASHEKKLEIFEQMRRELQIHTRAEQEIFYPAIKAMNGTESRKLMTDALNEHKQVDELLTQISRLKPSDTNFDESIETLFEYVDHHIEHEEGEIFQFVAENYSEEELSDIGKQIEERKITLGRQLAA